MATVSEPTLSADDVGIWREDKPGRRFGIQWTEIHKVCGYQLDCVTKSIPIVTLEWDYGEFMELGTDWPGFDSVVQAISVRLSNIDSQWFERIRALTSQDGVIEVWTRDSSAE